MVPSKGPRVKQSLVPSGETEAWCSLMVGPKVTPEGCPAALFAALRTMLASPAGLIGPEV